MTIETLTEQKAVGIGSEMTALVAPNESSLAIGEEFELLPNLAFTATDRPFGDCFRVRRAGHGTAELFAISTSVLPLARADILTHVKAVERPGFVSLLDWAMVGSPTGEHRLILIYDKPPGPQALRAMDEVRQPLSEEELVRGLLGPIHATLQDLAGRGVFHGAIRPTNIYYDPMSGKPAALGDCVAAPPGLLQPALCEPIERAQAEPAGRGVGTTADDMYALGMTLAILALGQNPLAALSPELQTTLRMDRGSYAAIIGNNRLPSALIEPLRGLLGDDPHLRWTLDDLGAWLGGRRQTPRQPAPARRGQRAIQLGSVAVWNPRALAAAMPRNVPESVKLVQSGELDRWLRRSFEDEACADRVQLAVVTTPTVARAAGTFDERLIARIAIALDPVGPIRYRDRAMMPLGIGQALAYAVARGDPVAPIAEIIVGKLPILWYNSQPETRSDTLLAIKAFDQYRTYLERAGFGYGVERCVYEMVGWLPCLSDMLRNHHVTAASGLLKALESVGADSARRGTAPVDRHVAGFLAGRDRNLRDTLLSVIANAADDSERNLAILNALASLQRRFGPPELPKLAAWFAANLGGTVERYHSRKTRQAMQKEIATAAQRGDLTALQQVVDSPEMADRDAAGFKLAYNQYRQLAQEIANLTLHALDRTQLEQTVGRETAALVSTALALVVAGGLALLALTR